MFFVLSFCIGCVSLTNHEKNTKKGHPLKNVEQMEQMEHSFVIKDLPCTSLFLHEEGLEQK